MRLGSKFFNDHAVTVARNLLGKILVINGENAIINETEAYRGYDDPASHAFRGPTPRSSIMFGVPAQSYVYMIYGMYFCLNIICEPEGIAAAVLIRGILAKTSNVLNGPGKLCRHFNINMSYHALDLNTSDVLYVENAPSIINYNSSSRVGISTAKDKLWRFYFKPE